MQDLSHLKRPLPGEPFTPTSPLRLSYSIENAAALLDVGRTTVFELIRTGRLKAVKLNGRTLVPDDALRDLLANLPAAAK